MTPPVAESSAERPVLKPTGPVVLTLAREVWQQRVRDVAAIDEINGVSLAEKQPLRRSSD